MPQGVARLIFKWKKVWGKRNLGKTELVTAE